MQITLQNTQGSSSNNSYTSPPPPPPQNGLQKGKYTPNTYWLIQKQPLQILYKVDVLTLHKSHKKIPLLESFFNKVVDLMTETPAQVFSCKFCTIFQQTLFTEHLHMIAPADPSVTIKVLLIDHTFFIFYFHFFFFLLFIIAIMGVSSLWAMNMGKKWIFFVLFTIIYLKINMNVVKTISLR